MRHRIQPNQSPYGFTLIELLIVVGIVLILIAISLPNFMEAMIRAKVTRAKSELRTLDHALLAYQSTENNLPDPLPLDVFPTNLLARFRPLTTPVRILSEIPDDPFSHRWNNGAAWIEMSSDAGAGSYCYGRADKAGPRGTLDLGDKHLMLASAGPDGDFNQIHYYPPSMEVNGVIFCPVCDSATAGKLRITIYNPTNGAMSRGDIYRWNAVGLPPGMQ